MARGLGFQERKELALEGAGANEAAFFVLSYRARPFF